jgi:hypothetical protein
VQASCVVVDLPDGPLLTQNGSRMATSTMGVYGHRESENLGNAAVWCRSTSAKYLQRIYAVIGGVVDLLLVHFGSKLAAILSSDSAVVAGSNGHRLLSRVCVRRSVYEGSTTNVGSRSCLANGGGWGCGRRWA